MDDAGSELVEGQDLVQAGVGHNARHQRGVHGVAGALGDHVTEQGLSDQRQVPDQVESLVPAALIVEPQAARIENSGTVETYSVIERGASNQAHIKHLVQLVFETERSSRSDLDGVALWRHFHL